MSANQPDLSRKIGGEQHTTAVQQSNAAMRTARHAKFQFVNAR
jgi:hypothetical protein